MTKSQLDYNSMEPLALVPNEVHLWFAHYDRMTEDLLGRYREVLAAEEIAQEKRFYFPYDRRRYLVTRALVRTVLSRYTPAVSPKHWRFALNAYGRPQIANDHLMATGLSFNISHTRGLIALAVGRHRQLGVDVEDYQARRVSLGIADQFFSPDEVAALANVPEDLQQYRFFEYWTFKESYIKARGMGLSLPLDQFSFHYPRAGVVDMTIKESLGDVSSRWQLWQCRPTPQVLAAICVERTDAGAPDRIIFRNVIPAIKEQEISLELTRRSPENGSNR